MSHILKAMLVLFFLVPLSGGCGGNQPVKAPTLHDEAASYTAAFARDMKLGKYTVALSDADKALAVNRILDRSDQVAVSLNNLGTVQERLGMSREAEASYEEAIQLSRTTGNDMLLAIVLNNFAGMVLRSDVSRADNLAREAQQIGIEGSWTGIRARAVHTRARAALERGTLDDSRALCEEALALAENVDEKSTRAACLVTLGRLEARGGDSAAAVMYIEKALAIDRELENPYAIAMDYTRLAEIHEMSGDEDGAAESRKKAREILSILGIEER